MDAVTAKAVVVEQNRPVVGLSTWIADAAVHAVHSGRTLQLVTPVDSLVTYPLEVLLGQAGGQWVVGTSGRYRDGLTASALHWDGTRFVPTAGTAERPLAGLAWAGGLEFQIVTPHSAVAGLELGASAEAAMRALTGRNPTGWGIAEPVTQPWSRREVTSFCRGRGPTPTSLVIVGGEPWPTVVGVLTVERVDSGVREQIRLAGPPLAAVNEATIETLAEEVADSVRSMIVTVHPGRSGGLRSSTPSLPALPYGILVGHQEADPADGPACRAVGRGARWYRLDVGPAAPYEMLTSVLRRYGLNA